MPKNKRSKTGSEMLEWIVQLTKVKKKGKEQKSLFIKKLHETCDKYEGCYVFHYENLLTKPYREIQADFASSK